MARAKKPAIQDVQRVRLPLSALASHPRNYRRHGDEQSFIDYRSVEDTERFEVTP